MLYHIERPVKQKADLYETCYVDVAVLRQIALSVSQPYTQLLEVGSWGGTGSTRAFGDIAKSHNGLLTCIDTWQGSFNVAHHHSQLQHYDVLGSFKENIKEFSEYVRIIQADSALAHECIPDGVFDCVFVDGNHAYSMARKDYFNYYAKVRPGGIICGHDYKRKWEDLPLSAADAVLLDNDYSPEYDCHLGVVKAIYDLEQAVGMKGRMNRSWSGIWWLCKPLG